MRIALKSFLLIVALFSFFSSYATNYTWTGSTNTNWSTATNWSPNGVPGVNDTAKVVSVANAPVLQGNITVKRFTMQTGTLNLNSNTLTVSNEGYFIAGTISSGTLILRGLIASFTGANFSGPINAINERIVFSGGIFADTCYFEINGLTRSDGLGGCVFNAAVTIKKTGNVYFNMGMNTADTFNAPVKFINAATYAMQIGYNSVCNFNDSLSVESTNAGGISFSAGSNSGGAILASGKKIGIGSGGFTNGILTLKNFVQQGNSTQNLTATGSAIFSLVNATFNGKLTINSPGILLKSSVFNDSTEFIRSANSSSYCDGGNTFNGAVTFRNNATNSASFRLAVQAADVFNSNVTFITSTGYIQAAYSGINEFKGNVSISSMYVGFNSGNGKVLCAGSADQTFSATAAAAYLISKFGVNKSSGAVTFTRAVTIDSLLELTNGIIHTSATSCLSLKAAAIVTGASISSYINGPIKKFGNTAFQFPIGKGNDFRPVTISAPTNLTDAFTAEYFNTAQTSGTAKDTSINYISECNYWNIARTTGTSNVALTFNWYKSACDVFDIDSTKLARWNGTKWIDGGLMNYTGNDSIGSVGTTAAISTFGNFVFGHKLIPQLSFQYTIDSLVSPLKVNASIISRGFDNNTVFKIKSGLFVNGLNSIFAFDQEKKVSINYPIKRNYSVEILAIGADTLSFLSKILVMPPGPSVNISYSTTPNISQNVLPCNYNTQALYTCFLPLTMTLECTGYAPGDDITITDLPLGTTPVAVGFGNLASFATISNGFTITNITVDPCLLTINLYSSECTFLTSNRSNSIKISSNNVNTKVYFNNQLQISTNIPVNLSQIRSSLEASVLPSTLYGNLAGYESQKDKEFYYKELVSRYYVISANEGIVDHFILKANYEEDVTVSSVSVYNMNTSTFVPLTTSPISGGSTHNFVFYNQYKAGLPLGYPNPPLPPNSSYFDLSTISLSNIDLLCSIHPSLLFNTGNGSSNYLLLKEDLIIEKIDHSCSSVTFKDETEYTYDLICDGVNPCLKDKELLILNVKCVQPPLIISTSAGYIENSSNPDYVPLNYSTNVLQVCNSYTPNPPSTYPTLSYGLIIKNATPVGTAIQSNGAATIKIKKIEFDVDKRYFQWAGKPLDSDFDALGNATTMDVYLGNTQLQANVKKNGSNLYSYSIDLESIINKNFLTSNPNLFGNVNGVIPMFNAANLQGGILDYTYLQKGHYIGVVFHDFKMYDCTSSQFEPLKSPGHDQIICFTSTSVTYNTMCDLFVDPTVQISKASITQFENRTDYESVNSASADPTDIGAGLSSSTKITFIHNNKSSTSDHWVLRQGINLFYCPNKKVYAIVKANISPFWGSASSTSYSFSNANLVVNGAPTSVNCIPLSSTSALIELPSQVGNNLHIEVDATVNCGTSNSFGMDEFIITIYETCDELACSDCFLEIGSASAFVLRHCNGDCSADAFASTNSFETNRINFGWTNQQDYESHSNVIPTTNPNQSSSANVSGYYPYDGINLKATGSIFKEISTTPSVVTGVSELDQFYFDVWVMQDQLNKFTGPTKYADPIFAKPLNTAGSYVVFTLNSTNPSSISQPLFSVPLSDIYIENPQLPSPYGNNFYLCRLKFNPNLLIGSSPNTLKELLQNDGYTIDLDINLELADLGQNHSSLNYLKYGYYDLHPIVGLFSYLKDDGTYVPSCDPYTSNMTYYQLYYNVNSALVGSRHKETFSGVVPNQCELLWYNQFKVYGGLGTGIDDFPGEFRPMFRFTHNFNLNSSSNLVYNGMTLMYPGIFDYKFTYGAGPLTSANFYELGQSGWFHGLPKVVHPYVLYNLFGKNCSDPYDSQNYSIVHNSGDLRFGAYANHSIPVLLNNTTYTYDPTPTANTNASEEYDIEVNYPITIGALKLNPSEFIPIDVVYKPQINNGQIGPNEYIYFTLLGGSNLVDFELYTLVGNIYTLVPSLSLTDKVFMLGDAVSNVTRNYFLKLKWNDCSFVDNQRKFSVIAHTGLACEGYQKLITSGSTLNYSCKEFEDVPEEFTVGVSSLTVDAITPSVSTPGCNPVIIETNISSLDAEVKNGRIIIGKTLGLNLDLSASEISLPGLIPPPSLQTYLSAINYTSVNGVYIWNINDVLSAIDPLNPDPHFYNDLPNKVYASLHLKLVVRPNSSAVSGEQISIGAAGNGICNEMISENFQICNIEVNPIPTGIVNITTTGVLCNGNPINLTAVLSPSPVGSVSYLWNTGATSQAIAVSSGGNYNVAVTNNGCTYVNDIIVETEPSATLLPNYTIACKSSSVDLTPLVNCASCTYLWSTGATSNTINVSVGGTYSLTVTNGSCSIPLTTTVIDENFVGSISVTNSGQLCTGSPLVFPSASVNVSPLIGSPFSYQWKEPCSNIILTGQTINCSCAGDYNVIVTNSYGCTGSYMTTINDITPLVIFSPNIISLPATGANTNITATVLNSIAPTNYTWNNSTFPNSNSITVMVVPPVSYTLTATNLFSTANCSSSASIVYQVDNTQQVSCVPFGNTLDQASFSVEGSSGNIINLPSGNYDLYSNIVIDDEVHIGANTNFKIMNDISITIVSGGQLIIDDGAHFYSCFGAMWEGFRLLPGSGLHANGSTSFPFLVEDAKFAIDANETTTLNTSITILGNSIFNANRVGIYLHDGNFNDFVFEGIMRCDKFLLPPYGTNNFTNYSLTHLKLSTAGSVYIGKNSVAGVPAVSFYDAFTCISAMETNLYIDGALFSQPNVKSLVFAQKINRAAVQFNGTFSGSSNPSFSKQLYLGVNNSILDPNKFDMCDIGVKVRGRTVFKCFNGLFHEDNVGIDVKSNSRSSDVNKSGQIMIDNNDFNYVKFGIDLANNSKVLTSVKNNRFNIFNGYQFDPLLEDEKAIYVHNAIAAQGGLMEAPTMTISENTIKNSRFGIQVMNQKYGVVSNNAVFFDIPNANLNYSSSIFRKGYVAEECISMAIFNNSCSRLINGTTSTLSIDHTIDPANPSDTRSLIVGFKESSSSNSYKENQTNNLPSAFEVVDNCVNATFECNEMNNGVEGFKMVNAAIPNQGSLNIPNGNKWNSWGGATRINGTMVVGPPINWYYSALYQAIENPGYNGSTYPGGINKVDIPYASCVSNPCPGCDIERLAQLISMSDTLDYQSELKYAVEHYVYLNLKDSMQLMYSGSIYDASLQNFFTAVSLNAIGSLENINELLSNNNYATAYFENNLIYSLRLQDQNNAIVNEICARVNMDFDNLCENDILILESIAYQYPSVGGEGVFRARAILGIDLDNTAISYRQSSKHLHSNINKLLILPNPNSGRFKVVCSEGFAKGSNISVLDQTGRSVVEFMVDNEVSVFDGDLSHIQPGIYYIKAVTSKNIILTKKLVIVK